MKKVLAGVFVLVFFAVSVFFALRQTGMLEKFILGAVTAAVLVGIYNLIPEDNDEIYLAEVEGDMEVLDYLQQKICIIHSGTYRLVMRPNPSSEKYSNVLLIEGTNVGAARQYWHSTKQVKKLVRMPFRLT